MKTKSISRALLLAVLLLPIRVYGQAQPNLNTDVNGYAGDAANYQNEQHSITDAVLTEAWTGSGEGASAALQLAASFGSVTLATSASVSGPDGYAGGASGLGSTQSTDYWTVNGTGNTGKIVARFSVTGDIVGTGSIFGSDGGGNYSVLTNVNNGSFAAGGSYAAGSDPGMWSGTPLPQVGAFTVTSDIIFGSPFPVFQTTQLDAGAGCNGYVGLGPCTGAGNSSLSLRFNGYTVTDDNDAPVNFTMQGNIGWGRGDVIPAGGMYQGFSVTNGAPGHYGSTFQLLDGTASAPTQTVAAFVAPPPATEIKLASDAVNLTGTNSDPVVIQMSYDPVAAQSIFGSLIYVEMAWFQNSTGIWRNAVLGNTGMTMPTFFRRPYNPETDFHLGYCGNDTTNHVVWAVVNHNSEFGVRAPLELVTMVSEKTHGAAGTFDINLPLSGTPGVECRAPGANGTHTLIITFTNNLVSGDASVISGTGSVAGAPTVSGNTMTVNLAGVTNAQTVRLRLSNVKDASSQLLPDTTVSGSFLLGDTTGNASVSSADVSQVKSASGQPVTAANFRSDVNANGSINGSDVSLVKSQSGTVLRPALARPGNLMSRMR